MKASRTLLLVMGVATVLNAGCSSYDKVSPTAYEYSKALYSVCNRHDAPRLISVASQIETATTDAQLTGREADWLHEIVATAQAGDWQQASLDARELMEAQVEGM